MQNRVLWARVLAWRKNGILSGRRSESSRNHKPRGNSSTFRLVENQEAVGDGESQRFLKLWIDFCGMTKRVNRLGDVIP
jgi:hypothetical protein